MTVLLSCLYGDCFVCHVLPFLLVYTMLCCYQIIGTFAPLVASLPAMFVPSLCVLSCAGSFHFSACVLQLVWSLCLLFCYIGSISATLVILVIRTLLIIIPYICIAFFWNLKALYIFWGGISPSTNNVQHQPG